MTSHTPPRAGFWLRLAATAIDYSIIAAICAMLGAAIGAASRPSGSLESVSLGGLAADPYLAALAGLVAGFALVGSLYMCLEVWTGATLGKRALGLVVVAEDGHPAPAGLRVARYLVKNCHLVLGAAAAVSGVWFVGALVPLATLVVVAGSTMMLASERRALHDVVAGTAVVARRFRAITS